MGFNINLHNCSPSRVDVPFEGFTLEGQGHRG